MIKNNIHIYFIKAILFLVVVLGTGKLSAGNNFKKVLDLNGSWRFSIGDNSDWAMSDYDDSSWEFVRVPSPWENQGFHGYDGFAWYRKEFHLPKISEGASLFIQLGNIDDVDEVFINGKRIGKSGNFPPYYSTAYNSNRLYNIPNSYLQENNTIAVRVYDDVGEGGIIRGDIAIVIDRDAIPVDINLQGSWKFKVGRNAHEDLDNVDSWDDIIVPGFWENQGYKNYDGYACYVLDFDAELEGLNERMVLVLGKIDDLDQVIINGILVGQSGEFAESTLQERRDTYLQLRGYYLPKNLIRSGENRIVVRVFDYYHGGGIYTGSVGLISQENYIRHWHNKRGIH